MELIVEKNRRISDNLNCMCEGCLFQLFTVRVKHKKHLPSTVTRKGTNSFKVCGTSCGTYRREELKDK